MSASCVMTADTPSPATAASTRPRARFRVAPVCDRRLLWRFGISGDKPLVLVSASALPGLGLVRSLSQALSLWSWGGQDRGWPVLGLGKMNLTASLVRIGSQTDWAYVSAGDDHNLVLKSDGTVWAWGANYRGQLGDGNRGTKLTNGLPNFQDRPVHTVAGSDWVKVEAGSVSGCGV